MATYTTNLVIELIGTGELAGTWGTTTNQNFQYVFEEAIVGRAGVAFSDANVTLTTTQATTDQTFRNVYLNCTGTNTAQRSLIVPTINKNYIVENNTTGGFAILVTTSGGTGLVVPNGYKAALYVDGTNVVTAFNYLSSLTVAGSLTTGSYVANGSITSSAYIGAYSYGTLTYLDTNNFATYQTSANSYAQVVLQNTSTGTAASADVIVSNNLGTASNYYGDFGINGSGFSGSGNFQAPNNVYLYSIGSDLAIGTQSSNAIHFIVGGATAADALILDSNQNLGLGVTPPSNSQSNGGLYIGSYASYAANTSTNATIVGQNVYYLSTTPVYRNTGYASLYQQTTSGVHSWLVAPSGTANSSSVTSGLAYIVASLGTTTLAQWQAYFSGLSTIPTVGQAITATATGSIAGGATVTAQVVFTTAVNITNAGTLSTTYDASIHGLTVGQGAGSVSNNTAVGSGALGTVNTGAFNDSFGFNSLNSNTSGTTNTAIGSGTLFANLTGSYNVAIGRTALSSNISSNNNTAVGSTAGYNSTGANNAFFGASSGYTSTGSHNTYLGSGSGPNVSASSGSYNVGIGDSPLTYLTTGANNTAVGYRAGYSYTTGTQNTLMGDNAGFSDQTGTQNTFLGGYSGYTNTGSYNTGVGFNALNAQNNNSSGQYNTAVGNAALTNNTSASYNTAVGYQAGYANTSGQANTIVGQQAFYNNTSGSYNVAIGSGVPGSSYSALQSNTTGGNNVAMGVGALGANTTASNNTAVGYQSLYSNQIGNSLVAVGYGALYSNTTSGNTAVGYNSLNATTTGANNVAMGQQSLLSNLTGASNVGLGFQSLLNNTTASYNTAVGYQAGYSNTTGINNAFLGKGAGYGNSATGNYNSALGSGSLSSYTSGTNNSCIGINAGSSITSGSYNVIIGSNCNVNASTDSNEIVIGSDGITGKGSNTGFINPGGGGVYQGNNSTLWSVTSDERLKKNIVDNTVGLSAITQIKVRNFEYRLPKEVTELDQHCAVAITGVQLGPIAQELQQVLPDCVKTESTGVMSVDSSDVMWHMVNAIKELNAEVQSLKSKLGV